MKPPVKLLWGIPMLPSAWLTLVWSSFAVAGEAFEGGAVATCFCVERFWAHASLNGLLQGHSAVGFMGASSLTGA